MSDDLDTEYTPRRGPGRPRKDENLSDPVPGVKGGSSTGAALAGRYRLLAQWDRLVKVEQGVRHYQKHKPGDLVDLDEADAERLLRYGGVECTTDEQRAMPAAREQTPLAKAAALAAQLGPVPAPDPAAAVPVYANTPSRPSD